VCSGSLFTNSNWFAFEDDRVANERSTGSLASPSPNTEGGDVNGGGDDNVIVGEDDELIDTATSSPEAGEKSEDTTDLLSNNSRETGQTETDKPPEWVEWRETSDSGDPSDVLPNGEIQVGLEEVSKPDAAEPSSSTDELEKNDETASGQVLASTDEDPSSEPSKQPKSGDGNENIGPTTSDDDVVVAEGTEGAPEAEDDKKGVNETGN
jgi:serine/threonine-protein phosphatase 6 regulatory subunit 3